MTSKKVEQMSVSDAAWLAASLAPRNWPLVSQTVYVPCEAELNTFDVGLSNVTVCGAYLRRYGPNEEDLHKIRMMLVNELSRKARVSLVLLILGRHETLLKDLRLQPMLEKFEEVAAHYRRAVKRTNAPIQGAELLNCWR